MRQSCRTVDDLAKMDLRRVNIDTNGLFITFYIPDLDLPPGAAHDVIKKFDYGVEAGTVNAAYAWKEGVTALEPMATLVVTASKAEAKGILERLRERADYKAFIIAAQMAMQQDAEQRAAGRRAALQAVGRHAEAEEVQVKQPITSRSFTASEAYIFEYGPHPRRTGTPRS